MKSHPALTKALRGAPKLPANIRLVGITLGQGSTRLHWQVRHTSRKSSLVTTQATQHPVNTRHLGGLS